MMKPQIVGSIVAIMVVLGAPVRGWADSPTETVKRLIESVRAYKNSGSSAQNDEANRQMQQVAEETLAIQDLAKEILGPHWEKIGPAEQKNFTQLLMRLFQVVAYPNAAEFFGDLQIEYRDERVTGSEAFVETIVSHPREGRIGIEYHLRQAQNKWMIWDVLLDGVSMVTNVRTQVQQVIARESYEGLVKRMREQLAES